MPKHRSHSHNRLLALEQELLEKKLWAKSDRDGQDITYLQQGNTGTASQKRPTNNRLIQLEQDIGQYCCKKPQKKVFQAQLKVQQNSLLALERELLGQKRKPKSKRSRVKSQVFDTGEAIKLQYDSTVFPTSAPKTAVSVSEAASNVVSLPINLLTDNETSDTFTLTNLSKSPSLIETDINSNEASELDLPATSPQVYNPQVSEETSQETENFLSQAAQIISESETQPYPLQEEELPAILAELKTDLPETPATPSTPQTQSTSDRHNPHAIFDRLGKNMAYATTFDVGTIELEQLFDEFDRSLDREQPDSGNSVPQTQRNSELEQRFDELDRSLDRQEKAQTSTEASPSHTVSEILSEQQSTSIAPAPPIVPAPPTSIVTEPNPNTVPKSDFKLEALLFRTGINLISLILWLLNLMRRHQIPLQAENNSESTLLVIPYGDRLASLRDRTDKLENPNSQIMDISQKDISDFTNEISLLNLSNRRSSLIKPTVDASTPHRDSLTGMLCSEFTSHNSYPLTDYSKVIKPEKNNSNTASLYETSHPPQKERNNSS